MYLQGNLLLIIKFNIITKEVDYMKKRILIPYASYGNGHKAIAEYIANYFKKEDPELEIATLDLITYSMKIIGPWSKKANSFLMLNMPSVHDFFYRIFNSKVGGKIADEGSMILFKNKKMAQIIKDFNPDLTISTHFFGSSLIAYYNHKGLINSRLITVVTDYEAHELWINDYKTDDYIIVGNEKEARALSKKGIDANKIKAFGIPIAPKVIDNFNRNEVLKKYNLSGLKPICVFFGGGGNGSLTTVPYIKKIASNNSSIDFIFIAGKNETSKKMVDTYQESKGLNNIITLGFTKDVPELLQLADFVVSKPGGVQSTECLYFKIPILMITPSGGQEIANYKYFEEMGYGRFFHTAWGLNRFITAISNNPKIITNFHNNMLKNNNGAAMAKMYNLAQKILKDSK
jgi:processive 1,2-diacylglycerol beta-glucosyltransferase